MHMPLKGAAFVFISAILYGSYGVWAVLLGSDFGNFFQGWVRAALVLALIVPLCFFTGKWTRMRWADAKSFAWPLGFLLFSQAPIYYAFQHAGVGITSLIFFGSYVVAAYIVGFLLLGEKMTATKIASLLLALAGLYFTFAGSLGAFSFFALFMAVVGGVSGGGGMSATKLVPKKFSALQILVLTWGFALVTHLVISLAIGERQLAPALDGHWLALVGFAVAGLFASWFVVEGLRHIDASIGGLISLLEVAIAVVFGYLLFAEELHTLTLFGGAIIILAAALPHLTDLTKRRA